MSACRNRTKFIVLLAVLALCLGLAGCAAGGEEEGAALWFAGNVGDWDEASTALESVPYTGRMAVEPMVEALLAGPGRDSELRSPFPEGTQLRSWALEDGLLSLDLSGPYGGLEGFELTLADYCLTLTLCELPGVERVSVTVEGRPMKRGYWEQMDASQALLSGAEERPVEVSADLYFPRAAGRGLGVEKRSFQLTEGDVPAEAVTLALLAGPEDVELSTAIPEGTQLLSLRLEDAVCWVDLSQALLDGLPQDRDAQTLLIYSIVNTLGNLSSVDSVCLQVEGETLSRLGQVELPGPLEPDFGLVEQ